MEGMPEGPFEGTIPYHWCNDDNVAETAGSRLGNGKKIM